MSLSLSANLPVSHTISLRFNPLWDQISIWVFVPSQQTCVYRLFLLYLTADQWRLCWCCCEIFACVPIFPSTGITLQSIRRRSCLSSLWSSLWVGICYFYPFFPCFSYLSCLEDNKLPRKHKSLCNEKLPVLGIRLKFEVTLVTLIHFDTALTNNIITHSGCICTSNRKTCTFHILFYKGNKNHIAEESLSIHFLLKKLFNDARRSLSLHIHCTVRTCVCVC